MRPAVLLANRVTLPPAQKVVEPTIGDITGCIGAVSTVITALLFIVPKQPLVVFVATTV